MLRQAEDVEFVHAMTEALQKHFPKCPPEEAQAIARHTALRGRGRVGRSAAGRDLDSQALELAVRAHLRPQHTNYDTLLMQGVERLDARSQVRDKIEEILAKWSNV